MYRRLRLLPSRFAIASRRFHDDSLTGLNRRTGARNTNASVPTSALASAPPSDSLRLVPVSSPPLPCDLRRFRWFDGLSPSSVCALSVPAMATVLPDMASSCSSGASSSGRHAGKLAPHARALKFAPRSGGAEEDTCATWVSVGMDRPAETRGCWRAHCTFLRCSTHFCPSILTRTHALPPSHRLPLRPPCLQLPGANTLRALTATDPFASPGLCMLIPLSLQVQQVHLDLCPCHTPGAQGGGEGQGREERAHGVALPRLERRKGWRAGESEAAWE